MQNNYKTKCCTVVDNGLFVEMALKLAKDFGKVNYWTPWVNAFPSSNSILVGKGLPGVERIDFLFDHIDETNLFVFPDVYFGDLQRHLAGLGKRVWGGRKGEELELYRDESKKLFAELGLPVSRYEIVTGMSDLRKYLKENKDQWVKISMTRGDMETFHSKNYTNIEPRLDELEYRLGAKKSIMKFCVEAALNNKVETGMDFYTIDGRYPDKAMMGIEIKDEGYVAVIKDYDDMPMCVKSFNSGIAGILKQYNYRGFASTEIRVGKDQIPYMIDYCFDDQTEVLTDCGWKFFKDLDHSERLATKNSAGFLEYQQPTDYIINRYAGKMIHFSNRRNTFDKMVTPNHLVVRTDRHGNGEFKERADSITDKGYIPRTAKWNGVALDYFILPSYHKEWEFKGRGGWNICTKMKHQPEVLIPMKVWTKFLAWYLTEGSLGSDYVVQISQTKYCDKVKDVLDKMPFKFEYSKGMFRICSIQLASYLRQFGICNEKFVPDYIKFSTAEIIRVFLDEFNLGDGSIHKGNKVYRTTSKVMADDIQEMLLKVGSLGNIVKDNAKGTMVMGLPGNYIRNHDCYVIYERNDFLRYWFETGSRKSLYINEVDYDGLVYCATVPNGTLFVRRNGKPCWSSNCARQGSPPSELYQNMYTNLADIFWYGADGTMVNPELATENGEEVRHGVEILLHSAWADKNWQAIEFPEEIRDNVKFRNLTMFDGKYYVVPQSQGLPEIGAVVAMGTSRESAIERAKEYCEQVQGYYIEAKTDSLDKAQEEIDKLAEYGIEL